MRYAILGLIAFVALVGCGKENGQPDPNLSISLVFENAEGVGAVLSEKDREAELARAEMIVRFSK